jgi:hypothetical protein
MNRLIEMSRGRQLVDLPREATALENGDGAGRDTIGEELGTTRLDVVVAGDRAQRVDRDAPMSDHGQSAIDWKLVGELIDCSDEPGRSLFRGVTAPRHVGTVVGRNLPLRQEVLQRLMLLSLPGSPGSRNFSPCWTTTTRLPMPSTLRRQSLHEVDERPTPSRPSLATDLLVSERAVEGDGFGLVGGGVQVKLVEPKLRCRLLQGTDQQAAAASTTDCRMDSHVLDLRQISVGAPDAPRRAQVTVHMSDQELTSGIDEGALDVGEPRESVGG